MNYFDTDNRKFAKEFVDYGIFSTDDTLPYKASEESAMGEYVHPLKDMKNIKLTKPKLHNMKKNRINMTESQLNRVIRESVRKVLREMVENKPSYNDWIKFLHGKEPIFEFDDDIVYVDYDEQSGCICTGGVSNAGFFSDGRTEIAVQDGDFGSALSELYDQLQNFYYKEWDEQD